MLLRSILLNLKIIHNQIHFRREMIHYLFCRMYKDRMRVFLGQETFIFDFTDSARRQNPQVHRIKKIFVHPNFRATTSENDIALLELSKSIIFNKEVQPICLPGTRAKRYMDHTAVALGT